MGEVEQRTWERARDEVAGRRDAWCSFCRRNHREVGPLAEAPDHVYICYRCTRLCADLIEEECKRRGVSPPEVKLDR